MSSSPVSLINFYSIRWEWHQEGRDLSFLDDGIQPDPCQVEKGGSFDEEARPCRSWAEVVDDICDSYLRPFIADLSFPGVSFQGRGFRMHFVVLFDLASLYPSAAIHDGSGEDRGKRLLVFQEYIKIRVCRY